MIRLSKSATYILVFISFVVLICLIGVDKSKAWNTEKCLNLIRSYKDLKADIQTCFDWKDLKDQVEDTLKSAKAELALSSSSSKEEIIHDTRDLYKKGKKFSTMPGDVFKACKSVYMAVEEKLIDEQILADLRVCLGHPYEHSAETDTELSGDQKQLDHNSKTFLIKLIQNQKSLILLLKRACSDNSRTK